MLAVLLAATALAAPPEHPVTLSGGLVEAGAPGAAGLLVIGRATAQVGRGFGLDVASREGLLAGSEVALGAVSAGVRWTPTRGPHLRAAFLHHHETPWLVAKAHPIGTVFGSLPGIVHRSGVELGVGVDLPVAPKLAGGRLGGVLDLSVGAFPDAGGPAIYVFLEQSVSLDVGRRRAAAPLEGQEASGPGSALGPDPSAPTP